MVKRQMIQHTFKLVLLHCCAHGNIKPCYLHPEGCSYAIGNIIRIEVPEYINADAINEQMQQLYATAQLPVLPHSLTVDNIPKTN